MKEIWKKINSFNDYMVSDLGRVKSLKWGKEKMLKQTYNYGGYLTVNLYCGKMRNLTVHSLVAISFLNHTPNGHKIVVDHIDNDKTNNRLDNLQLISNRENASKDRIGVSRFIGVSWSKANSKWMSKIRLGNKQKYLGYFKEEYTASIAYQTALHNYLNK